MKAMSNKKNYSYETIDLPYNANMERSVEGVTGAPAGSTMAYDTAERYPSSSGTAIVRTGQELSDLWLTTWMKSRSYAPKSKGFILDAKSGDAEFQDIWIRTVTMGGKLLRQATSGITAYSGGGEASATVLTYDISEVATVAAGGDSVRLPTIGSDLGREIKIINHGGNALDVFPNNAEASDEINGAAGAVSLAANETLLCIAYAANSWEAVALVR